MKLGKDNKSKRSEKTKKEKEMHITGPCLFEEPVMTDHRSKHSRKALAAVTLTDFGLTDPPTRNFSGTAKDQKRQT